MLKRFFSFGKKVIFAFLVIYAYDVVAMPLKVSVPVNFVNVGLVSVLGVPALLLLIVTKLMFF